MTQKIQNSNSIKKYYDSISNIYDKVSQSRQFSWNAPRVVLKTIKKFIKPSVRVLDLGIGTGQSSEVFYEYGADVTGIDISKKSIALVKKKYPTFHLSVNSIDAFLSRTTKKFDIIIACGVLEFIPNIEDVICNVGKIVRSNGIFVFTIEEYIVRSKIQHSKVSLLSEEVNNPIPFSDFNVYRMTLKQIKDILKKHNINLLIHKRFIGYYKTKKRIPVFYSLFVVSYENLQ